MKFFYFDKLLSQFRCRISCPRSFTPNRAETFPFSSALKRNIFHVQSALGWFPICPSDGQPGLSGTTDVYLYNMTGKYILQLRVLLPIDGTRKSRAIHIRAVATRDHCVFVVDCSEVAT